MIHVENILQEENILFHQNQGITIASVATSSEGISLAKELLYAIVDIKTVLYLSGGSTPKALYKQLANEQRLVAGALGLIDERYGKPMHEKSNELMIRETGLLSFAKNQHTPLSLPLQGLSREETARVYDQTIRQLHATFQKSVGILGIGSDGHTAGIAPKRKDFNNPLFSDAQKHLLFSEFSDPNSFYGERITTTFLGLSMLDYTIILVFGKDKQSALELIFRSGSEEEIPARFFKRPEIAKKTLLITDQQL